MKDYIAQLVVRYPVLKQMHGRIKLAVDKLINSLEKGGTLFVCGNGGSGSDAEHIAGEMLKGFLCERRLSEKEKFRLEQNLGEDGKILGNELQRGLRCISLLSHPGFSTAFANDVNPLSTFAQQLYVLGRAGDLLMGISTSGNSENVRRAFMVARATGIGTLLLTGGVPGTCARYADVVLGVPETETYKIQELHLPLYHMMCMAAEDYFFGSDAEVNDFGKNDE